MEVGTIGIPYPAIFPLFVLILEPQMAIGQTSKPSLSPIAPHNGRGWHPYATVPWEMRLKNGVTDTIFIVLSGKPTKSY